MPNPVSHQKIRAIARRHFLSVWIRRILLTFVSMKKIYLTILEYLASNKNKSITVGYLLREIKIEKALSVIQTLHSKGYIREKEVRAVRIGETIPLDDTSIIVITPPGELYIEAEMENKIKESREVLTLEYSKGANNLSSMSLLMALIAVLISIWLPQLCIQLKVILPLVVVVVSVVAKIQSQRKLQQHNKENT